MEKITSGQDTNKKKMNQDTGSLPKISIKMIVAQNVRQKTINCKKITGKISMILGPEMTFRYSTNDGSLEEIIDNPGFI